MDWTDIEAKLQDRVVDVCEHLLPHGKREGAEWVCGNLDGQPGRSLRVNLAGKVGLWADFAGDKSGKTLISLWCSVRSRPFKECIVEAKGFLGIRDDFQKRTRSYENKMATQGGPLGSSARANTSAAAQQEESSWRQVAETWSRCQPVTVNGPVWNYLVEKRRIDPVVMEWYGVREMFSKGQWVMVFPYFAAKEEKALPIALGQEVMPSWLKFEALERVDGKKREWTSRGPEKMLWGCQVAELPPFKSASDVLICEGEKDAMSWATLGCAQSGVVPVSVPFGAKWKGQEKGRPSPNREWIDRCWDWLQGYQTVFVAMDSDDAGKRAAADIIG
ncbi:MAG TPA: hypothetical protein VEC99_11925, partial [Clostridia bacterium]|nr:hypothetical protein [Clostridia bacterium]